MSIITVNGSSTSSLPTAGDIVTLSTTDQLSEGSTNLYFTNERVDDRVNGLLVAGTNISLVYDDVNNTLTVSADNSGGFDLSGNTTDDLAEGTTNLYYTNTRVQDWLNTPANKTIDTSSLLNLTNAAGASIGLTAFDYAPANWFSGLQFRTENGHRQFMLSPAGLADDGTHAQIVTLYGTNNIITSKDPVSQALVNLTLQANTLTSSAADNVFSNTVSINDTLSLTGQLISTYGGTNHFEGNMAIYNSAIQQNFYVGLAGEARITLNTDTITAANYDVVNLKVDAGEEHWAAVTLSEYVGGAGKPINSFTNPGIYSEVHGGTRTAPAATGANKRILSILGSATVDSSDTMPNTSSFRILAQTSENQTPTNRGTYVAIETTANGSATATRSVTFQGNTTTFNGTGGDAIIKVGGTNKLRIDNTVDARAPIIFVNLTTTERDALSAQSGMVIFNTSTSILQVFDGSNWVDLH
jgi:hypothetical protein